LAEIFFAVLVVAVAVLMAVDVARTPNENPLRQAGWQAPDAARAFTGSPAGAGVTEFRPEPGAPGIPAAARDAAPARPPESAGPIAGSREPVRDAAQAVRPRSSRALQDWRVSSRLWLMAGIAAVGGAVVAFCAVRIAGDVGSASFTSPVDSVRHGAITSAIGYGVALVIVLALAAWFAIAAARSVLRPLGRLRAGVVEMQ